MRYLIILLITLSFQFSFGQSITDWKETHISNKYGYTISIPKTFAQKTPSRKNIDFLFVDNYGSSININVTDRLPDEYKINGHNYSKEMLEKGIRQMSPNYIITYHEKTYIDNQAAFLAISSGEHPKLSSMTVYFFYKDKAYVITSTAETERFDKYKDLFLKSVKSLKLKK